MKIRFKEWSCISILIVVISACGGGGGGSTDNSGISDTTAHPSAAAKTGSLPIGSSQCPTGGVSIDTGIDQNGNGVLDSFEVTNTVHVCNGQNSINSLVKTTSEAAGTNCTSGGIRLNTGLDLNSNGSLDSSEITSTSYVCNGSTGTTTTSDTNVCTVSKKIGPSIAFTCDGTTSRSQIEYYPIGSCGTGIPLKTCTQDNCSSSQYVNNVYAGYYSHSKQTGSGCSAYEYESLMCQDGFTAYNGQCISDMTALNTEQACTAAGNYWWNNACHKGCPSDQVASTRGCEVPVTSCTPYQDVVDNLCVDLSFTAITGNICGQYLSPVKITTGNHLVTCDSDFEAKTVIEAGANLLVDNNWGITFKDIYAKGTTSSHIVFTKSGGNPAGGWKRLTINNGASLYHYVKGYFSGNYMSYIDISGLLDGYSTDITINKAYLENLNWNSPIDVTMSDVYVKNSSFTVKSLGILTSDYYSSNKPPQSLFTRNTVTTSSATNLYNTFSAWSIFNTAPSLSSDSALMFSTITSGTPYCSSGSDNYVYGNKVSSVGTYCTQSDNSSTAVSNKTGAYILNNSSNTIFMNQNKDFEVYVLNSADWLTASNVIWKATYDVDGIVYNYPITWSGYNPTIMFTTKEAYKLNIDSIDGSSQHMGKKAVIVNVW